MQLVTLDGLNASTNNTIPHFSALKNPEISDDITNGSRKKKGAALGLQGAENTSEIGVFRDTNGNKIFVSRESTNVAAILRENNLIGDSHTIWHKRFFGAGSAEQNADLLRGIRNTEEDLKITLNGETKRSKNFIDILEWIENTGIRHDKAFNVVLTGSPVTFGDIAGDLFSIVLAVAKPFAATLGIPPSVIDAALPVLEMLAGDKPISIRNIGAASQFLVNNEIRGGVGSDATWLNNGLDIFDNVRKGDYAKSARMLGVSPSAVQDIMNGNMFKSIAETTNSVSGVKNTITNLYNSRSVNALRNSLRTGSVIDDVIETVSATKVESVQDFLFTSHGGAILSSLPNYQKLAGTIVNETQDLQEDFEAHKGFIMSSLGYPTFDNAFDGLTVQALSERAIFLARRGAEIFVMPNTIPVEKRTSMAKTVNENTGMPVYVDEPDGPRKSGSYAGAGAVILGVAAGIYGLNKMVN